MATGKYTTEGAERRLALALSILAHILFVIVIIRQPVPKPELDTAIDITIEPPSKLISKPDQIAPPSERKSDKPPETNRLSEVDSTVEREQIRRGDGGGKGAPEPPRPAEPRQPPPPKQKEDPKPPTKAKPEPPTQPKEVKSKETQPRDAQPVKDQPKEPRGSKHNLLTSLKLDDATLSSRFGEQSAPSPSQASKPAPKADLGSYRAFSRPAGSGASFMGSGGVADYLPNLPDGDITLLNEKASTYAGFVRRVAVQVFAQLRSQGWERLSYSDVRRMTGFTTVEAVLSPSGSLVRVNLVESSGSSQFDGVLTQSVNTGARDPNPPAGAKAADGMIHFIFKARSWADVAPGGASGIPSERRWLLLATGLE